ncbi:hypothetical protein V2J09_000822 [Rumex salicifolius]
MNEGNRSAEAVGCKNASVGERSTLEGSNGESRGGRSGSENVGLSNENISENPMPRKPKGSSASFIHGGPKIRPKGVVDGQQVNIPILPLVGPEGWSMLGERSTLEGSNGESRGGRSGSENVGLSNENISENPMPRKPKGSSASFIHGG